MNPNLFFAFYKNKVLGPEIENQYIAPQIEKLVAQHDLVYLAKMEEREQKVDECSNLMRTDCCYQKCCSLITMALGCGAHVGGYFILLASNTPASTALTFLATLPATAVVSACFSPCASHVFAKYLARCCTPGVPNEVVDLNDLVTESEVQNPQSVFSV
ncbi:MAG: hypothetical protein ACRCXC_11655 [Legionella sp.]